MSAPLDSDLDHLTYRLFSELRSTASGAAAVVVGDPGRVDLVVEHLDHAETFEFRRGFRGAAGTYAGQPIRVLSHGIGGGSFERALVELTAIGIDTVIRVGTTGALLSGVEPGELIINDCAVRLDGTSSHYVRPEYPAAASWDVTAALVTAANKLQACAHVGVGATTSSFFAGQARDTLAGWVNPTSRVFEEMTYAGVLNFEMEAATLFTLARLFGIRAGAVCVAVNNRIDKTMGGESAVPLACRVALEAIVQLRSATTGSSESFAPDSPPEPAAAVSGSAQRRQELA